jgi:hypothetical protein
MPITMPLTPKIGVISIQRIKFAVSARSLGAKPRATVAATIGSAKTARTVQTTVIAINAKVMIDDASCHARFSSRTASAAENVGMNAEPSAPPATILKIKSGMLKRAGIGARDVPNWWLMTISPETQDGWR